MPLIVTPDDIDAALVRTDALAQAIDDAAAACPEIDASTRQQWADFLAGYRIFAGANKGHSFFALGLPNIGNEVVGYEHELNEWRGVIAKQCTNLVAPALDTHDDVSNRTGVLGNGLSLSGGTTFALGVGAVALLVFAIKR